MKWFDIMADMLASMPFVIAMLIVGMLMLVMALK